MPLLVKDVVANIKRKIALLPEERTSMKPLVRIESFLTMQSLIHLLDQFIGSNELATRESLEIFLAFLSDRWDEIQETDAVYPHAPDSLANQCCLIVAEELSDFFYEHAYFLMMPSLQSIQDKAIQQKFIHLKMYEFVFADDGVTPIEVATCLDQANQNKTTILYYPDHPTIPLSKKEADRVIDHCGESIAYYGAMEYREEHRVEMFDQDVDALSRELHEAFNSHTCLVKASYGDSGKRKLINYIIKNSNHARCFIRAMLNLPDKRDWRFLTNELHLDDLHHIILGNDLLLNCVQRQHVYTDNENYNRAILYCFVEIYIRQRTKVGDTNVNMSGLSLPKNRITHYPHKWFNRYGKPWLGGYSMSEKLAAARALQQFLINNKPLHQLKNEVDHLFFGALFEGDLGIIASQVETVMIPKCLNSYDF